MTGLIFTLLFALKPALADDMPLDSRNFTPIASIRLGLCAGFDPSCVIANGKLEVNTKRLGFQATFPDQQSMLKIYLSKSRHYAFGSMTHLGTEFDLVGCGIACDVHLKHFENLGFQIIGSVLQPSLMVPNISLGMALALGKAPDRTELTRGSS